MDKMKELAVDAKDKLDDFRESVGDKVTEVSRLKILSKYFKINKF